MTEMSLLTNKVKTISPEDTSNVKEVLGVGDDKSENEVNVEQEN